ncbi:MAG: zinc-binding dehydrogenase [Streptomycetaceae bacterium]|nr:zinc-binding dehydrogenase [Streptomycetaceae bacterium]
MRAVVLRAGELVLDDIPEPPLGPGQLLVEPLAVGVCGSDLSAWRHTREFTEASRLTGMDTFLFDPDRDLVMGHEFSSRVVAVGDGVEEYEVGDTLFTLPWVTDPNGVVHTVGYATDYPGALAERVVVQAAGHLKIPAGVSPDIMALLDPLTVGPRAISRSHIPASAGALVTGCGPVGLGAVAGLAALGIAPIVASDPSASRRELAARFGAHAIVDPRSDDPAAVWSGLASKKQRLYVFEASGAKGLLNTLFYQVPRLTRIYVVGSNMEQDVITPLVANYKDIAVEFCLSNPDEVESEFAKVFRRITSGEFDPSPVITAYTGLEGAPKVFEALRPGDPAGIEQIKVIIRPDLHTDAYLDPSAVR